jgi:hypothetical protein
MGKGLFHVVDDRQDLEDEGLVAVLEEFLLFLLDPFAVVLQVGSLTHEFVPVGPGLRILGGKLLLQRLDAGGFRERLRSLRNLRRRLIPPRVMLATFGLFMLPFVHHSYLLKHKLLNGRLWLSAGTVRYSSSRSLLTSRAV